MNNVLDSIKLPAHFIAKEKLIKIVSKMETTKELMQYFSCKNPTEFSRFMKPIFPNRPGNMSYLKYLKSFSEPNLDQVPPKAEVVEPRIDEPRIDTCPYVYDSPEWKKLDIETKMQLVKQYPELKKSIDESIISENKKGLTL